jgi:hypothetical protein
MIKENCPKKKKCKVEKKMRKKKAQKEKNEVDQEGNSFIPSMKS